MREFTRRGFLALLALMGIKRNNYPQWSHQWVRPASGEAYPELIELVKKIQELKQNDY